MSRLPQLVMLDEGASGPPSSLDQTWHSVRCCATQDPVPSATSLLRGPGSDDEITSMSQRLGAAWAALHLCCLSVDMSCCQTAHCRRLVCLVFI